MGNRILGGAVLACSLALLAGCTSASHGNGASSSATRLTTAPITPSATAPDSQVQSTASTSVRQAPATSAAPARTSPRAASAGLPLRFGVGAATEVITAIAPSTSATQGRLQAWQKSGSGWVRVGPEVHAWFGTDGLTTTPSESRSATPIGSFTLTEAFGHDPDPGTALPYRHTTPSDWWISQGGPLYNTEQHCATGCHFTLGPPNEHLYYETPYYDYAVVIDYNRFPVRQGAGSAFFLHVTVGAPTQGCISIDKGDLVRILRWLTPSAHPRILIGLG